MAPPDIEHEVAERLADFAGVGVEAFRALTQNEQATWFEALSAHDIAGVYFPDFSREEAIGSVVGGAGDTQIDSICVFVNGQHIATVADFEEIFAEIDIENLSIFVIQATLARKFIDQKMDASVYNVADLFEDRIDPVENEKKAERRRLIAAVFAALREAESDEPRALIKYYYVACGDGWDGETKFAKDRAINFRDKAERTIKRVVGESAGVSIEVLSLERYKRLMRQVDNRRAALRSSVIVEQQDETFSASVGGVRLIELPPTQEIKRGFLGVIDATQFVQLLERPDGLGLIEDISRYNVRNFLSENNAVNQEIAETIEGAEHDSFVFRNNGVFITADEAILEGDVLRLENYHIVNGLQTSNILYNRRGLLRRRIANGEKPILVVLKIAVSDDPETRRKVSRASNRQTGVQRLEVETNIDFLNRFAAAIDGYAPPRPELLVYFQRDAKAEVPEEVPAASVIDQSELLRAVGATLLRRPHAAALGAYPFVPLIPKDLFNDSHRIEPYLMAAQILVLVERFRAETKEVDSDFRFHMAAGLFLLAEHHPAAKRMDHHELSKAVDAIMRRLTQAETVEKALRACERSIKTVASDTKRRQFGKDLSRRQREFTAPFFQSIRDKKKTIDW